MSFKVHLIPDKRHLFDVGCLENGALFWIDSQLNFETNDTRDFVATYVFDLSGRLIWHLIEDLGLRSGPTAKSMNDTIKVHKSKLGKASISDIWISPFSIEEHGLTFGLSVRELEIDEEEPEFGPLVDALPGYTLMFYPPWEEGAYDT